MSPPVIQIKVAVQLLSEFCARCASAGLENKTRLSFSVRGNFLTLIDGGPTMFDEHELHHRSIAQFRYNASRRLWSLYRTDRHGKWHQYNESNPTKDFQELIRQVDEDPLGIFWLTSFTTG
jgi:hypothetical protein